MFSRVFARGGHEPPSSLITRNRSGVDRVQHRQTRLGTLRFGQGGSIAGSRTERWRYANQLFVEKHDRSPFRSFTARPLAMRGLNCGFELKPPVRTALRRLGEMAFRFFDEWTRPALRVLFRKGNIAAIRPAPGRSPRFAVEHENQQPPNLRLIRH